MSASLAVGVYDCWANIMLDERNPHTWSVCEKWNLADGFQWLVQFSLLEYDCVSSVCFKRLVKERMICYVQLLLINVLIITDFRLKYFDIDCIWHPDLKLLHKDMITHVDYWNFWLISCVDQSKKSVKSAGSQRFETGYVIWFDSLGKKQES